MNITNYKPFYIQASGDATAINTNATWDMVAKSNPYPILPSPKDPYSNDWLDEDGDDEYVTTMHYEPIEFDVQFYIKEYGTISGGVETVTAEANLRTKLNAFFDHIKNGNFKTYDAYAGIGFDNVRYAGYEEESYRRRTRWNSGVEQSVASAIFTVSFKCNSPLSRMTYNSTTQKIVSL